MKTLYFECGMGAAGDMLTASLFELFDNKEEITAYLNSFGIEGVRFLPEPETKCGIRGTHMSVLIHGEEEGCGHHADCNVHHHGRGTPEIKETVDALNVSDKVKSDVLAIYDIIAAAESEVHGVPIDEIHFHEVGTLDAVADITAVCALIEKLSPDRIVASPVNTGSGTVKCAHGILPVPAPATAVILKGIPAYSNGINSELCTPTGAAILRHFADEFAPLPQMIIEKTGYGMGKKDFETANCVRAFTGYRDETGEDIIELRCNIDDMTGEEIAFACERCFDSGALDVYTVRHEKRKAGYNALRDVQGRKQTDPSEYIIHSYINNRNPREFLQKVYSEQRDGRNRDSVWNNTQKNLPRLRSVKRKIRI